MGKRGRPGDWTEADKLTVLAMWKLGNTMRGIARITGISDRTVWTWVHEAKKAAEKRGETFERPFVERICRTCGKPFMVNPALHTVYCSAACKERGVYMLGGGKKSPEQLAEWRAKTRKAAEARGVIFGDGDPDAPELPEKPAEEPPERDPYDFTDLPFYYPAATVGGRTERQIRKAKRANKKKWAGITAIMKQDGISYAEAQKRGYFDREQTVK